MPLSTTLCPRDTWAPRLAALLLGAVLEALGFILARQAVPGTVSYLLSATFLVIGPLLATAAVLPSARPNPSAPCPP